MNDDRQNGRVLKLGQTRPETIPVKIEGRDEPLKAWVIRNGRYPVSVAAELEDARTDYRERWVRVLDGPPAQSMRQAVHALLDATREGTRMPPKEQLKTLLEQLHKATVEDEATPRWRQRESDYQAHLTRVLTLLIPGLEEHEADMLGQEERVLVLEATGYYDPQSIQEAAEDSGPPVQTASSTGVAPEPASAASTAA